MLKDKSEIIHLSILKLSDLFHMKFLFDYKAAGTYKKQCR